MKYLLILCIGLVLFACKPTTQLRVIQPAAITLPEHIEVLATVDRSKPSSGFVNVLEGGVTGEVINQDKNGRRYALDVLSQALTRTPRFRVVSTDLEYTGSETGSSMTSPLPWREIESICREYDADAVIALEMFDSDNLIETTARTRKTKDDDDNEIEETVFDSKEKVSVRLGWRIYDPYHQEIIDEVAVNDEQTDSKSASKTKEEALDRLEDPLKLTYRVSETAGRKYAERIAPIWINVSRTFYKKAKGRAEEDMARAARHFEADSWQQAVEIWRSIIDGPFDREVKGMATYNLAVASEKRGLLGSALDWAQKAYAEFDNKKARNYIQTLKNRIRDQEILEQQMRSRT
ncbi:MAG: DUF6340 family protein [Saprospiraceae bacterium]|nr:DUF6340 family protein [Saprospiraceae bacterium]